MIITGPLWTVDVRNGWRPTVPAFPTRPTRDAGRTGGVPVPTAIDEAATRAIQRADNGVSPSRISHHFSVAGASFPGAFPRAPACRSQATRGRTESAGPGPQEGIPTIPRRRAIQLTASAICSAGTANFGRAARTAAGINRRVTRWPY